MKNIKSKLLLPILCLWSINTFSQTTSIPDQAFEQALINLGYDTAPIDGTVPTDNISGIEYLILDNQGISDFTGLQDFASLYSFYCSSNPITSIDLSGNINLWQFYCSYTSLDTLDFTNNSALTFVYIEFNALMQLKFPSDNLIYYIECDHNQLSSLDLEECTNLTDLHCTNNNITTIDLSNNPLIDALHCDYNNIAYLDLSNLSQLSEFTGTGNQLETLDLSNNSLLDFFICDSNQLGCINLANGNNMEITDSDFSALENPLNCIEVDDPTYSQSNWSSGVSGYTFNSCLYSSCNPLSVENNGQLSNHLKIYPNPTSRLSANSFKDVQLTELEIYNSVGVAKYRGLVSELDNINLEPGIYVARGRDNTGIVHTARFIIK